VTLRRVYVVDDELLAIKRLVRLLEATGRVDVVGQATDPRAAVAAIAAARPELVFLDISMPELDGFEVCQQLPPDTMVVFTTAHDEHALRAFRTAAIDYLLKPVREDELARALDKLDRLRALPAADAHAQLAAALAAIGAIGVPQPRIASRLGDKVHFVELDRITHFSAEDKLTYAVTAERSYIVDRSINELEQQYAVAGFFRIHRATLVRLAAIVELHAATDGTRVRLTSGSELAVARERARALKDKLGL
jgi:two-component system, LytTR family, response regulator